MAFTLPESTEVIPIQEVKVHSSVVLQSEVTVDQKSTMRLKLTEINKDKTNRCHLQMYLHFLGLLNVQSLHQNFEKNNE